MTSLRHVPIIRLFVSSTFSDLKQERDALQTGVFRKLEILCREYGFQFEAIDLRWGISEETGLNHRVMRICLEELTRSQQVSPQPNFLILLGNRYGWRPLPEAISSTEYGLLAAAATALAADKQARIAGVHGKTAKQVLDDWYRLDENALVPPTVPLQPIDPAPDCEVLNYLLQPRTQDLNDGRDYTRTAEEYPVDTPEWDAVQDVLWRIINEVFAGDAPAVANRFADRFRSIDWKQRMAAIHRPQRPMRSVPQAVRFQGSATEQEIWCGALSGADSGEHVLAFFREIDPHQELEDARLHREYFDGQPAGLGSSIPREVPALSALKQALRDRLGPRAVDLQSKAKLIRAIDAHGRQTAVVSTEHLGQLCDEAYSRLEQCILAEIARYRMPSAAPPQEQSRSGVGGRGMTVERELEIERQTHRRFAQERGSVNDFVGRQLQRRQIEEYLGNDSRAPFVVSGASGSGKSALLARVFHDVDSQAGSRSILRFIGATRDSSDLRSLLTSLCQELGLNETPAGARSLEIRELLNTFILQLVEVSGQQQVVLFLDALDQLADADGALRLFWIPRTLPRHVKFVVSCLSDRDAADPAGQPYAELTEWSLPPENFQRLEPLEPEEARGLLFDKWLPGAGRTIPAGSRQYAMIEKHLKLNAITADVDEAPYRQPLYLRLVFEEVRLWASYDSSAFLPEPDPSRTYIETLLEHSFQRLEREANHGRLLVARALGYLAAARRGLTHTELLEILFADQEYGERLREHSRQTCHELPVDPPRIPTVILSRLRYDLSPFLAERAAPGGTVIAFYHRQVAEWIRSAYLEPGDRNVPPDPQHPATARGGAPLHARLAEYFQNLRSPRLSLRDRPYFLSSMPPASTPPVVDIRAVDELPFHRLQAATRSGNDSASPDVEKAASLFRDLPFLEAKMEAGLTTDLVAELRAAANLATRRKLPSANVLRRIDQAAAAHAQQLAAATGSVLGILQHALYDAAASGCADTQRLLADWESGKATPWLKTRYVPERTGARFLECRLAIPEGVTAVSLAVAENLLLVVAGSDQRFVYNLADQSVVPILGEAGPSRFRLAGYQHPVPFELSPGDSQEELFSHPDSPFALQINQRRGNLASRRWLSVVDAATNAPRVSWRPHGAEIRQLLFLGSPFRFATFAIGEVAVWDLSSLAAQAEGSVALDPETPSGHGNQVWAIDVSPAGDRCVSLGLGGDYLIWDLAAPRCIGHGRLHDLYRGLPGIVRFVLDARTVLISNTSKSSSGDYRLLDVDTGVLRPFRLKFRESGLRQILADPRESEHKFSIVAVAPVDGRLLWRTSRPPFFIASTNLREIDPHGVSAADSSSLYESDAYRRRKLDDLNIADLVCLSHGGSLFLRVDAALGMPSVRSSDTPGIFSHDLWSGPFTRLQWNVSKLLAVGVKSTPSLSEQLPSRRIAWSQNGEFAIVGDVHGRVAFIAFRGSDPQVEVVSAHTGETIACAIRGDGRVAVTVGEDRRVILWECASARILALLPLDFVPGCCAIATDGSVIAVGMHGGELLFLSAEQVPLCPVLSQEEVLREEERLVNRLRSRTAEGIQWITDLPTLLSLAQGNAPPALQAAAIEQILERVARRSWNAETFEQATAFVEKIAGDDRRDIPQRIAAIKVLSDQSFLEALAGDSDPEIAAASQDRLRRLSNVLWYVLQTDLEMEQRTELLKCLKSNCRGEVQVCTAKPVDTVDGKDVMEMFCFFVPSGERMGFVFDEGDRSACQAALSAMNWLRPV